MKVPSGQVNAIP